MMNEIEARFRATASEALEMGVRRAEVAKLLRDLARDIMQEGGVPRGQPCAPPHQGCQH